MRQVRSSLDIAAAAGANDCIQAVECEDQTVRHPAQARLYRYPITPRKFLTQTRTRETIDQSE